MKLEISAFNRIELWQKQASASLRRVQNSKCSHGDFFHFGWKWGKHVGETLWITQVMKEVVRAFRKVTSVPSPGWSGEAEGIPQSEHYEETHPVTRSSSLLWCLPVACLNLALRAVHRVGQHSVRQTPPERCMWALLLTLRPNKPCCTQDHNFVQWFWLDAGLTRGGASRRFSPSSASFILNGKWQMLI